MWQVNQRKMPVPAVNIPGIGYQHQTLPHSDDDVIILRCGCPVARRGRGRLSFYFKLPTASASDSNPSCRISFTSPRPMAVAIPGPS